MSRHRLSCGAAAAWLMVTSAAAAGPVNSVSIEDAKALLGQYAMYSNAQDPLFYELYSDRAVIRARIDGFPTVNVFQGRAYKQWLRELVQTKATALDASVFQEATVERRGGRLVIRAKRYALNRCYWDPDYRVGIEREGAQFRIVEEIMTTQPQARCDAAQARSNAALIYNAALTVGVGGPLMASGAFPNVNVGATTSFRAPLPGSVPVPLGVLPPPPGYSLPSQPVLPVPRALPPAPPAMTATMTPQEQAALAMRMAQQIAASSAPAGSVAAQVQSAGGGLQAAAPVSDVRAVQAADSLRVTPQ
jgi:hypothetical protein